MTFTAVFYAAVLVARSGFLYFYIKQHGAGWRGRLITADPDLGFRMIPNARGAEILSIGPDVPVRIDADGFRVPLSESDVAAAGTPRALAIGCSFTFGAACVAEETYTSDLSRTLGFRCINAGVPSFGLSQVVIQAQRLIPRYHPDYVIVQYSPWLVARSQVYYAPSHFGKFPTPYFFESAGDTVAIHPPEFSEIATELPITDYRDTPQGFVDFCRFAFRAGLPLYLHDDCHAAILFAKRQMSLTPAPCKDRQKIVDGAYGEISRICKQHHAKMLILVLDVSTTADAHQSFQHIPDARVIDAHGALLRQLRPMVQELSFEAFVSVYGHRRGNPPQLIDHHPNRTAHWIISVEISRALREMEDAKRSQSSAAPAALP